MTRYVLILAALASALAFTEAAEGWSWPDGQQRRGSTASSAAPASASRDTPVASGRSEGRRFFGVGGNRYDIVDPDSDDFTLPHPEDLAPGLGRPPQRPPFSPQRPPFSPQRPFPGEPDYPLGGLGGPNPGYRPPRPLGPGPAEPGRPLGGVGSDPTSVSKCKCVHAFNCEASALQFGSCDAGKRYCCNKEPRGLGGPRPGGYGAAAGGPLGGPGYRPAILTGPGGPGSGGSLYKGDYDRYPGSGSSPALLVGPRPTYYRPDPAAGFASGPGDYQGSPNGPYRDYGSYNRDRGYGLSRP